MTASLIARSPRFRERCCTHQANSSHIGLDMRRCIQMLIEGYRQSGWVVRAYSLNSLQHFALAAPVIKFASVGSHIACNPTCRPMISQPCRTCRKYQKEDESPEVPQSGLPGVHQQGAECNGSLGANRQQARYPSPEASGLSR